MQIQNRLNMQQKLFLVFMSLMLPNAFANDAGNGGGGGSSVWNGLSGIAKSFFDWFSGASGSGSGGDSPLVSFFMFIERITVIFFAILSQATVIMGFFMFVWAILLYRRNVSGREPLFKAHSALLSSICLGSAKPLIDAIAMSLGFSGDNEFNQLSGLAQSCAGVMGEVCANADSERIRELMILTTVRVFRTFGFLSAITGFYYIYENGKGGNGKIGFWGIFNHILIGTFLMFAPEFIHSIANGINPDSEFTNFFRKIRKGDFEI